MDYNSERAKFEAFRCNLPRTTGIVQWMLNSAWPSIYWQLYDWKHAEWWGVNILEYADVSYVCRLPEVALAMQVEPVSGGFLVSMENPSETVAYQNILKARDASGQLVPCTFWEDNFFTLLPGEKRTVRCTLPKGSKGVSIVHEGWNGQVKK